MEITGQVADAAVKQTKKGDDYGSYKINMPGGGALGFTWFSTYGGGFTLEKHMRNGNTYRVTYDEEPYGEGMSRKITAAVQVDPSEFGAQPASNAAPPAQRQQQGGRPPTAEEKGYFDGVRSGQQANKPGRTYDEGVDKKQASIEAQTALNAAVEFVVGMKMKGTDNLALDQIVDTYARAFRGTLARLQSKDAPAPPPEQRDDPMASLGPSAATHAAFGADGEPVVPTEGLTRETDPDAPADMGELLTWVKKNRPADVSGTDLVVVREVLGFTPEASRSGLKVAYDTLRETWGV